jgi:hypothetical protein
MAIFPCGKEGKMTAAKPLRDFQGFLQKVTAKKISTA